MLEPNRAVAPAIPTLQEPSGRPIIEVSNLVKRFDALTAVDSISFEVREGEIFGFLGPNGAGKSTTIKMLCTLLKPSGGSLKVAGYAVTAQPDAVRQQIGIIFQDPTLDSGLTAVENLEFHCMMYHVPRAERPDRIHYVLDLMDLEVHKDRLVKTYSGGMRRRLEIARGLLHRPRLLFLDEPTVGLDPQTRNYIWQYVKRLRDKHQTTIFMTTHYMDEAEHCDRIAIIDHGVIVALDTPAALKKLVGQDQLELTTSDNPRAARIIEDYYKIPVTEREGRLTLQVAEADRFVPALLGEMPQLASGLVVNTLQIRKPTLEDVFLKLTGRLIREEEEGKKDERRLNLRKRRRL
jgi:ABC-2 type transport system ATP-binding protein